MKPNIFRPLTHALFFLLSFILLAYFCKYGFNEADEAIPLNGGIRILNGELPWRDFQGYIPGIYVLHALIFKIFGMDVLIVRRVMAFFMALLALMILRVSERMMPLPFALLAACLYLVAPGVYYAQYIGFFSILNIALFARYCENKPNSLLYLGTALGMTFLFRHEVAFFLIGTSLASVTVKNLIEKNIRALLSDIKELVLGFSIIAIPVSLYIATNDLWKYVKIIFIIFNKDFVSSYKLIALPFPAPSRNSLDECAIFYFPIIIYFITFISLLSAFLKRRLIGQDFLRFYILLAGVFTFNQAIWRTQPENILKTIIPALVLYGFFSHRLVARFHSPALKAICALLVLALPLAHAHNMITKYPFYLTTIGVPTEYYQRMELSQAHVYAGKHIAQVYPEIVSYIKTNTREQDPIYIMPFLGIPIYHLAEKRNVNFFEWFLPPDTLYYPNAEKRIADDLDKSGIDLVIYNEYALDNRESRRFKNYAPNYYRHIFDRFYLDKTFGNYWMLRKGASNIASMQATHDGTAIPLIPGQTIGQTFLSKLDNLHEIKLRVASPSIAGETLILRLFEAAAPTEELARIEMPLSDSFLHEWIGFSFPEIKNSAGKLFYFTIESAGKSPGRVAHAWASTEDRYADGNLFKQGLPQSGDLTFIALASHAQQ